METTRLKVKVGIHEFDAEGPPEQVTAQFQAWKELIGNAHAQVAETGRVMVPIDAVTELKTREGFAAPWDIFATDDRRDLMTLKVHPPAGETRDADAILLIMFGYRKAGNDGEGMAEVPVTKLKESLDMSGIRVPRIDRAVGSYLKAGYLLKSGRGKGGIYRLTTTGYGKAEEMAQRLVAQLA